MVEPGPDSPKVEEVDDEPPGPDCLKEEEVDDDFGQPSRPESAAAATVLLTNDSRGSGASSTEPQSPIPSPLRRLHIEENERLKKWRQGERLGRGAYGEVFKAMVNGQFMAVKKIQLDPRTPTAQLNREVDGLLLEINTLRQHVHPRIVRYLGCIRDDSEELAPQLLIFLEFMPSGSISAVLKSFGPYGMGLVRKYTRQILEGLEFLHSRKIVHRDVKGANVLVDTQGDAKLADFGACRQLEALHSTMSGGLHEIKGSVYWMAPEVMKYNAGRRSDIWSTGCTMIEMITAEPPWPNLRAEKVSLMQALQRIADGPDIPPLPEKVPDDCRSFLKKTLVREHSKRPYAKDLLAHRFLAEQENKTPQAAVS